MASKKATKPKVPNAVKVNKASASLKMSNTAVAAIVAAYLNA